jgi:hypothetical protein
MRMNVSGPVTFLLLFQDGICPGAAVRHHEHNGAPPLQSRSYDPQ